MSVTYVVDFLCSLRYHVYSIWSFCWLLSCWSEAVLGLRNNSCWYVCTKGNIHDLLCVQSMSSCLIRMRVGGCLLPRPSLRKMYSLNWEESTPPPHEPVIQNPLCCNRSNTCSHTQTKQKQHKDEIWDGAFEEYIYTFSPGEGWSQVKQNNSCTNFVISRT